MFLIPFAGTIYRPYASTSENINLLSGIYFCGVHIQSGRLQSDSHQPVAEKSSLFFIKKRNKLIINCILIAAILFFMNYATLTICKVLLELPFPFVLSSPGLRLIMIIWLVEIVIVSLSITSAFTGSWLFCMKNNQAGRKFHQSAIHGFTKSIKSTFPVQ